MTKTPQEVTQFLDSEIPASAIMTRRQGQTELSYVDTHYVISALNEAFSPLGWDSETVEMTEVPGNKDRNGEQLAAYRAKVRITAMVSVGDGGYLKIIKEGTGWGCDKYANNPHEMASKEAESDALKRAAMKFGRRLGLQLYDKGRREDESPKAKTPPAHSQPKELPKLQQALKADVARDAINKRITAMSKVLLSKAGREDATDPAEIAARKAKATELKERIKKFGVDTKEALSDNQAKELLTEMEKEAHGQ
jgi:hypothetical protein